MHIRAKLNSWEITHSCLAYTLIELKSASLAYKPCVILVWHDLKLDYGLWASSYLKRGILGLVIWPIGVFLFSIFYLSAIIFYYCFHKFEELVVGFYGAHCTLRISATYLTDKKFMWGYFDGVCFYCCGNRTFYWSLLCGIAYYWILMVRKVRYIFHKKLTLI